MHGRLAGPTTATIGAAATARMTHYVHGGRVVQHQRQRHAPLPSSDRSPNPSPIGARGGRVAPRRPEGGQHQRPALGRHEHYSYPKQTKPGITNDLTAGVTYGGFSMSGESRRRGGPPRPRTPSLIPPPSSATTRAARASTRTCGGRRSQRPRRKKRQSGPFFRSARNSSAHRTVRRCPLSARLTGAARVPGASAARRTAGPRARAGRACLQSARKKA